MKRVKKSKGRTEAIRAYLRRARGARTLSEICTAIGATAEEAKFVSATALRLVKARELKRRHTSDGYKYTAA